MENNPIHSMKYFVYLLVIALLVPFPAMASSELPMLDLTQSWIGYIALGVFILAYFVVVSEEFLHLRKSKPVIVAAGLIWVLVGYAYNEIGDTHTAETLFRANLLEFAELMLFLLAAMTYINTMEERQVFNALRAWLVRRGFSLYKVFWITGILAFCISPLADNLTTALLMAAVVMAVAPNNPKFISIAAINIVVAANAGGAFSPFGDITTLMVWQAGMMHFTGFFALFVPSVINWLVPAFIMSFAVSHDRPESVHETVVVEKGGFVIVGLFLLTISMAVSMHNFLHLPPVLGMMTGLGFLKFYGYYLKRCNLNQCVPVDELAGLSSDTTLHINEGQNNSRPFDIFSMLARSEWDTLMFFYGVVLCVGGLSAIGYLAVASGYMYQDLGATPANILVGVLSAIVDNIPVMFAVLSMQPDMSQGQWLLVTLTAGVGGSLLSIGSAAGVALMGQTKGLYTFFGHLKWSWAIALGYMASIASHLFINSHLM